jgi:hypothetical protein
LKKIMMLLLLAMTLISGCVQDNDESIYDKNQDQAGLDLTTEDDGVRRGDGPNFVRDKDDGMTMTDQNPNLLNTDNENHLNFSMDVEKAKEVISAEGYEPGAIWINGGTMSVTAKHDGRMSSKERASAVKSLDKKLTGALPRYEINVDIE